MGVIDLGLTVAEFWAKTPRRILSFLKRRDRSAQLIGFYIFTAMGAKKEGGAAFTLTDFGLGNDSADEHFPTMEEYLEGERLGEERLRAFEAGLPNPQPAEPLAEIQAMLYKATEALPKNGQ